MTAPAAPEAQSDIERRRTANRSSADVRAERTRRSILEAVERLAGSTEPITVARIVRAAGISRGAFYTHYSSLDELASALLADGYREIADVHLAARAGGAVDPVAVVAESQRRIVDLYVAHRALFAAAESLSPLVRARAAQAMADLMEELYRIAPPPEGVSTTLGARYTAEATTGLMHAWVAGEVDADPEQLTRHLLALMPVWLPRDAAPVAESRS